MFGAPPSHRRVFCGNCHKSWARKTAFEEHFKLKQIKSEEHGDAMNDNPCHNPQEKGYGCSLEEAKKIKSRKHFSM